jgi:NADH-quinone oxidoreductase subunit M
LGLAVLLFINKKNETAIKWVAVVSTAVPFILSILLYLRYDFSGSGFQFVEKFDWIKAIGVSYHLAVDGISLPMVFIATMLTFICVLASWNIARPKEYFGFLLLLAVGMTGVFLALDFILFYVFWELVLIPVYFLIGIWGGPRREYAAIKFFLYTFIGSVIMLAGILGLYFYAGARTFDMLEIAKVSIPLGMQKLFFLAMFFGFAVKVPIVPFHTWLPDAYVEAPTAISVLLAGVLSKMGSYAFIRIGLQVIPAGMKPFLYVIAMLGAISIIYGALCAMAQKDLKKLVAYSSVSHMGFVMLGIASFSAFGIQGAVVQMFSHGVITGLLFLLVGAMYDRTHTRIISDLAGMVSKMSILTAIFIYAAFASLGMPALSGFIGEFLVLLGSFSVYKAFTIAAALGIVITAGYMIWTVRRISLGQSTFKQTFADANALELSYMLPLCALMLILGVYPLPLLKIINPAAISVLSAIGGRM